MAELERESHVQRPPSELESIHVNRTDFAFSGTHLIGQYVYLT